MKGNNTVRFSDLFGDTVRTHGKFWEVHFWLRATEL